MPGRKGRTALQSDGSTSARPPITVALIGHRSAGKTDLAEALLERARVVREAGRVADGTSLLDCDPESRARHQTTTLGTAWFEWNGRVIQLLDTPGASFGAPIRDGAVAASDLALVVVDGTAGIEHGTRDALASAARHAIPAIIVVTKGDRAGAEVAIPGGVSLQLPFPGAGQPLEGLIDVVADRVLRFADDGSGAHSPEPVPSTHVNRLAAAREALCEAVASIDDRLLERYLEFFTLDAETLQQGLVEGVRRRALVPVISASAFNRIGIAEILDAILQFAPDPPAREASIGILAEVLARDVDADGAPFHLLKVLAGGELRGDWVDAEGRRHRPRKFYRMRGPRRAVAPDLRTGAIVATWDLGPLPVGARLSTGEPPPPTSLTRPLPSATWAVRPADRSTDAALGDALRRVVEADPGLLLDEGHLSGQDEEHLKLAIDRLHRWSGIAVHADLPRIGLVEIPLTHVEAAEGIFLETDADGLPAAYGRCVLDLQPVASARVHADGTFGWVDAIGEDEENLPKRFRAAVQDGVKAALVRGPGGWPVVGARFVLRDGAYDMLVSTDGHLQEAARRAAESAIHQSGTRVFEPWRRIEITAPAGAVGDLIADLTSHRGQIVDLQVGEQDAVLVAESPYRELRTYGSRLRAITAGRGRFAATATHYQPAPDAVVSEEREAVGTSRRARAQRGAPASHGELRTPRGSASARAAGRLVSQG